MKSTKRPKIGAALLGALLLPAFALSAAGRTIVSLSFDDGTKDQLAAAQILSQRGLRGTFFINSGEIGTNGFYMSVQDLRALQRAGHELGGHTLSHPDLTKLSPADLQHEVCDDRAALQHWGLDPQAFDYPFGFFNDAVVATVKGCGYKSARSLGGIACPGCADSETIPPVDPFAIRTPAILSSSTALGALKAMVTNAEQSGGGWIAIVMHRVCDGCTPDSISASDLASFADWLVARAGAGTAVQTFSEVVSGFPPPNLPPSISRISPVSAMTGTTGLTLTIDGNNFVSSSTVKWSGESLATNFIGSTRLTVTIPASDLAVAASANITVFTPGPGGGTSAALLFTVASRPQINGADSTFMFHDAYAFPSPSRRGQPITIRLQTGVADSVAVSIFDLSGSRVNGGSPATAQIVDDGNGKGPQYTYDSTWAVSGAGSGVYTYTITAKKAGQPDIFKMGAVGVLK